MTGLKRQQSKLVKKYSTKRIFAKAVYSSVIGLPISMALTYVMVHTGFIVWASTFFPAEYGLIVGQTIASGLISLPFFVASFTRMHTIDWAYQKYGIKIAPQDLIEALYHRIHHGVVPIIDKDEVQK